MDKIGILAELKRQIALCDAEMAALRAEKPGVESKRSDGKRVRYVRREERAAALAWVLEYLRAQS